MLIESQRVRTVGNPAVPGATRRGAAMPIVFQDFVPAPARKLTNYAIENGEHLLITGPRGSGKTELVLWAAKQAGRPCEVCHLGSSTDVEATLQGTTRLKNSETSFSRSRFVDAVSQPQTVVVLEEVNRSLDGKTQGILLPALDGQKSVFLDQEEPGRRVVEVASGVVFVATANVGSAYTGTEPLDAALLDRMLKMRLDYSPREIDLLQAHGLSDREARKVLNIATEIRRQSANGVLTDSISTRGLVRVARMLQNDFELYEAFEAVVGVWDDESSIALRTILKVGRG
jgi:MoxR-like ATPase